MKNNSTKKSLKASALSLMLCLAMLIGTTFAWFTDSITNSGNKIQAGNLKIDAMAYDTGVGGMNVTIKGVNGGNPINFEKTGQNLKEDNTPIISEELFEPGKSNAKLLQVTNNGNLAAKIKLDFKVSDNGLMNSLWFDFVKVDENGVIGTFDKKPMSQLDKIGKSIELPLLNQNENVKFVLIYGMDDNADNSAQGKSFTADVSIVAKQEVKETDGFGNPNYDKDAEYHVVKVQSGDQLIKEIKELKAGDKLNADVVNNIEISETFRVPNDAEVVIDGNKNKIELPDDSNTNKNTITNKGKLKIKDCTIVNSDTGNTIGNGNTGSNAAIVSGGDLILENCNISNSAGMLGAYSVIIDNGTAVINNCDIYGTRGGLAIANDAVANITGGTVSAAYYYPVTAYGNGHSVCTGVNFVKVPKLESQNDDGGNAVIYNAFEPEKYGDKGSLTFNNCKFKSTRTNGSILEFANNFRGLTFNSCTYENVINLP